MSSTKTAIAGAATTTAASAMTTIATTAVAVPEGAANKQTLRELRDEDAGIRGSHIENTFFYKIQ